MSACACVCVFGDYKSTCILLHLTLGIYFFASPDIHKVSSPMWRKFSEEIAELFNTLAFIDTPTL